MYYEYDDDWDDYDEDNNEVEYDEYGDKVVRPSWSESYLNTLGMSLSDF